ncbi:MAG: hypothetical protein GWM90_22865, partial [Gemmatimonadetes bacterium]|nr:hypothetical protein [Gemmatimonadota bacterium]NIQ57478.1 hypothetical protein [Gemmatimonadota bacterium]NIU77642.1 hypothetical protein [Gammaproteobacteria bacterium]NIX46816.1 hypothetical protein [Gemmatimonadota bacterium]NIY11175.1 hypothetical protein [Gemmatimonadota bacterium]
EQLARGLDAVEPLPAAPGAPEARAEHEAGEWRLVVRRPLGSGDAPRRLAVPTGQPVPMAFLAQDGSSGEAGGRGAISSWYYLYLDTPVSATVYTLPVTAGLITALLGWIIVARARRAERRAPEQEPQTQMEGA